MENLASILGIPIIKSNRRYWFVRTVGGQYREEFVDNEFIGINWNDFSDISLIQKCQDDEEHYNALKEELAETLENPKNAGRILGQIIRFVCEMSVGDVVIIPTEKSTRITFGIVESDIYVEQLNQADLESLRANGMCDYLKRRKVKWIKTVYREKLDPLLYKMLRAHQTISCCDEYADQIDRTLEAIYVKDDKAYLTVQVKQPKDIKAHDMYSLYRLLYDTLEIDEDDIIARTNIQSEGIWQLITDNIWVIVYVAFSIKIAVGGGKISFLKGFIGEVETPGVLNWLYKFKELKNNKEIELKKIELERYKIECELGQHPTTSQAVLLSEIESYREVLSRLQVDIPISDEDDSESNEE